MRKKILVILFIALIFIVGCSQPKKYVEFNKNAELEANTKDECESLSGLWIRKEATSGYECNLPTKDTSKECSSSDQCEGACLAQLSQEDFNKAIREVVYATGKCAAWKITRGCNNAFVENGKVTGILCID